MRLGHTTITIRRAATKAAGYGTDAELDWSAGAVTDRQLAGCSVQPTPAPEDTRERDNVAVRWVVRAPGNPDVTALDRAVYAGEVYDIDGQPEHWPHRRLEHTVINLRRSTG